jgi:hypothetical protein
MYRLGPEVLQVRKPFLLTPVRILHLDLVLCRFAYAEPAASDMHSGKRTVIVGSNPADRQRGDLDLPRCSFRTHCGSPRCSPSAVDYNYLLLTRAAL